MAASNDNASSPNQLSMANLQQNAQRVGFLLKYEKGLLKGLFGRSWKRKYCVLNGYHFYFFKNKKGTGKEKSNGVINLRYFDKCTVPTGKQANVPHAFCLASSQKSDSYSFLFQADSVDEQQRWMTDIQLVIFQCQTQGRSSAGPNAAIRQRSQPGTPLTERANDPAVHDRPRTSSIPEAGHVGVYRTMSTGEEKPDDDVEPTAPPEASVSRSESRNAKPDLLVPRMPKYNQVVSELQSKLHTHATRTDSGSPPISPLHHPPSSRSSRSAVSPHPDTSNSPSSISSYDNAEDESLPPPPASFADHTPTSQPQTPKSPPNLDAQFDNVLKMMAKLADEEEDGSVGPEYAIPFKNKDRPVVPPKPKRELYETLLANHVTYQDVEKMYLLACKALIRAEAARELHEDMMRRLRDERRYANLKPSSRYDE